MLPLSSPNLLKRGIVCFVFLAGLIYLRQHFGNPHRYQSSTASPAAQTATPLPTVSSTGPGHELEPLSQSPWSLDQLIASDPNHYPPWDGYKDKDYDPNRWHFWPLQSAYYTCVVNDSTSNSPTSRIPYQHNHLPLQGTACVGPRGLRLNESTADLVHAYTQSCEDFPKPLFGSYEAVGLDDAACFDRQSRYAPYGFGSKDDPAAVIELEDNPNELDWSKVPWGSLQKQCVSDNLDRTASAAEPTVSNNGRGRSAVLIRTWDTYKYEENDLQAIRSLVSELSLQSRGYYEVFLFVHVKDNSIPLWTDQGAYDQVLLQSVPTEFRDMAILWNEAKCASAYPRVGTNEVYWQQWQPVQLFAAEHKEFEYVWNWEMDIRYIGHHLHFFSAITSFAAQQPSKYLWERSSRYYVPGVHGTWAKFAKWTESLIAPALSIWGPVPSFDSMSGFAEVPSSTVVDDNFVIGVGVEADLITSLPLFDPENTFWAYRDKIWNYIQAARTPRRVYINTFSRISRKLLNVMHEENKVGRSMVSEMWPATVAFQYGFKAVYAPHPIWSSREWSVEQADSVFNAGSAASPGTSQDSVYSPDREHNFASMSWYFCGTFSGTLYRRFLGWDVKDEVGDVRELEKQPHNRLCLPGMLLHPVKNVRFEDRRSFVP